LHFEYPSSEPTKKKKKTQERKEKQKSIVADKENG
jgi:hypothetical protein